MDDVAVTAASDALAALAGNFWEACLRTYPTFATAIGDRRYDAFLKDLSRQALGKWRAELE